MQIKLTVTEGPHQGEVFEFRAHDMFIVGRSQDAQFRLPFKDKTLSRVHFMIEVNPPRCRLMDMASRNGTFVNGERVTTFELEDGDVIRGGRTTMTVGVESDEPPEEVTQVTEGRPADRVPVIPRYPIERELGRGGMGIVYLAHGASDGAAVALKTITPAVAGSDAAIGRFLREAGVLRQLDHPHIVRFLEIGHADDRLYFVMEYVPGRDARALLKENGGPLPIRRAVGLACQTLKALAYAHDRGFVHRDIKPRNLLVTTADGRDTVKVADFGLARLYQDSPMSGLSVTNQFAGTSGFMAPEQITHFREAKPPADQYALGATLYYLLTGQKIYDFPNGLQKQLLMILQQDPVPIRARRQEIPEGLAAIIHRSLARSPQDRFPDAESMRAALARFRRRQ